MWHIRGKEIITDVMVGSDEVAEYCYTGVDSGPQNIRVKP
jgi:hypothetical protein